MSELKGFKTYRHTKNPIEQKLHDEFKAELERKGTCPVDLIVYPSLENNDMVPQEYLTDKEKCIMLSTVQWLGSPVGQTLLRECGFVHVSKLPK